MRVLLLRFGELYLKGNNRHDFEKALVENIKLKLKEEQYSFSKTFGRYIISAYSENREVYIVEKLKKVFGLYSISPAQEVEAEEDKIINEVQKLNLEGVTFRVNVKRADKSFPMPSMKFAALLGEKLLEKNKGSKVELYSPEKIVNVDIRMNKKAYIFCEIIKCQGGLPAGTAGDALLLLSGGIDSPVAGYLMAKRGLKIQAVHFHSYPYTSEQAKGKVLDLAKKLSLYCDEIKLHIVSFTKIQEQIHVHCKSEYMITIMRRIMMRIAEQICQKENLGAVVTGESLGQVASQTMNSMHVTGRVVNLPIFRPCIAMDKEEIMDVARKINTYEISILPYEDCCTVFLPKNPVIKPTLEVAEREEKFLDIEALISEAINNKEVVLIK